NHQVAGALVARPSGSKQTVSPTTKIVPSDRLDVEISLKFQLNFFERALEAFALITTCLDAALMNTPGSVYLQPTAAVRGMVIIPVR
ncbi:MAG: hypothetical protein RL369_1864, partial [Pseudomonadota bacterium]